MECYRCGTPIDEQTTFCPSCNAPQIRVTVPAGSAANQPATAPLPPGTPASIEPPAVPLHFTNAAPIDWKKFLRVALPLSLLAGFSIVKFALGLLVFIAWVMGAVSWYRRKHSSALTTKQGAKLGAVAGLLSFVLPTIVVVIVMVQHSAEYRQQAMLMFQQRLGPNPDPQTLHIAQWFSSPQGFVLEVVFTVLFLLAIVAIISSLVGAISAAGFANRSRR